MKVRLNLATAPLENNRRFLLGASLVGGLAFVALVWLSLQSYQAWYASREMRMESSRLQSEIRRLRQQRRELEELFRRPATRATMERAAFLNALIAQRSFPWTRIFQDLERTLPVGVRVVSLAPRMNEGRVELRLIIGAASDEAKLEFLKAVEAAPEFSRVQALSETRATRADQTDRIQLELVAWYRGE